MVKRGLSVATGSGPRRRPGFDVDEAVSVTRTSVVALRDVGHLAIPLAGYERWSTSASDPVRSRVGKAAIS